MQHLECTKFLNWHSLEVVIQNFVCTRTSLTPCAGTADLTGLTAEEGPGFLVEPSSTPLYAFLGFLSFAPRQTSVSSPWKRGRRE